MNHNLDLCTSCDEVYMPSELHTLGHAMLCDLCYEEHGQKVDELYDRIERILTND